MTGFRTRGGASAFALSAALLLALWFSGSAAGRGASPSGLACPSGRTVWLRGTAAPGVGLLARFGGRDVGGGSSSTDGSWAIPITVRERPGVYSISVVERQDGEVIATFTCYVDLPPGATTTPMPTRRTTGTAATPAGASAPPTSTPSPQPTRAASAEPVAPSPTPEPEATPPQTAMATVEPGLTTTPTAAPETPPAGPVNLTLAAVQPDDPKEPGLFEYVIVENASSAPQALAGWRLVHCETGEAYIIPPLTLPADELLVVWSGDGQDDVDSGSLSWPSAGGRWAPGQTVELYAPDGRLVSTLVVPALEGA